MKKSPPKSLFKTLFLEGQFADLRIGMSDYQVLKLLGVPRYRGSANGMVWWYGDKTGNLEVMFGGRRVNMIMITYWKQATPVLPKRLLRGFSGLASFRRPQSFIKYWNKNNVIYNKVPRLSWRDQVTYEVATRSQNVVQLIFDRERNDRIAKLILYKGSTGALVESVTVTSNADTEP
ncbi:MAG TPA: hypothetical protein VGB55_09255 [Tepidisphaeraceae bacterium]|jgi:hypothetical protein